ncbi:NADH dehydrogenase [ubiquinone] (complex I) alpha subcomplex subunit 1 [Trinorchestia longiramus]|nr:NADH dehydrogenase [ubiquinone] (complex I) alpha subcomplex subunit 1 [Trinorchestia longiramus]
MWYEMIPGFAICTVALALPAFIAPVLNKLALGNSYQRLTRERYQRHYCLRDERLSGDTYKTIGLEGIPDEPPKKQ